MSHILVFRVATELVDRGITVRHLVSWDGLIAYHGHLCTPPSRRHLMVLPLSAPSKHKYEPHNPDSALEWFNLHFWLHSTARHKITQRETKPSWVWPFFEKPYYEELISSSFIGAFFFFFFLKWGETFGISSFYLVSNFERILGSEIGYSVYGTRCLNLRSAYARLAWPTHSNRTS